MSATTPLRIVYVFADGDRSDLALGHIDTVGTITVDVVAAGQESEVNRIVTALNAQQQAFRREVVEIEGFDRPMTTKTAVMRGAPDFLDVQRENALRIYGIDLVYDAKAFDANPAALDWPEPPSVPTADGPVAGLPARPEPGNGPV